MIEKSYTRSSAVERKDKGKKRCVEEDVRKRKIKGYFKRWAENKAKGKC